jgi:glycosyltransferase involved in cell wall biosynthesis
VRAIAIVKHIKPDIKALIIGDGPERSRVQMLIAELNLHTNVHILSHVEDHADLYSLMKASKMLVLPSVREGFGLVAVEANAAGIPVITTSHEDNAAKDLIHEGVNGLLSETNPESVAEKIVEVLHTGESMNPRWGIEQYDWQFVTKKLEKVFS